jgi:long-chain acyl-CoA synthetase
MKFSTYLASHAQQTPDKDAVVCGDVRWSFAELERRTDALASGLQAAGLQAGDRVAVVLPSSAEFVEAFIATVKAGGVAVTINTRLSAPEVAFILKDSAPRFVFANAETADKVAQASSGLTTTVVGVGVQSNAGITLEALKSQGNGRVQSPPPEFDDAMICYTSGTTGFPKGAILTQANYIILNGFLNAQQLGMTRDDRHLVVVSLANRTGFARLANMMLHGATLVIMPRFDPQEAAEIVQRERITVFGMVPTVGRMMLDVLEREPQKFKTLRMLTVTGEAFPIEVKKRLAAALPQVKMFSFFGQTEAGAITLLAPEEQFTHAAALGRVNPGVEVRLVDENNQPVAQGQIGEIQVRSGEPGRFITMRGYFNRPEETAKAFHEGWLSTGDMGRFDDAHYLYIVDRKKDMVLTGGYNVYSKEVETVLLGFPGVEDAAVFGIPDPVYGESVAAAIEARNPDGFDVEALLEHCKANLAGYKKPKLVKVLTELPRNSNGKVLKNELRQRYGGGS